MWKDHSIPNSPSFGHAVGRVKKERPSFQDIKFRVQVVEPGPHRKPVCRGQHQVQPSRVEAHRFRRIDIADTLQFPCVVLFELVGIIIQGRELTRQPGEAKRVPGSALICRYRLSRYVPPS